MERLAAELAAAVWLLALWLRELVESAMWQEPPQLAARADSQEVMQAQQRAPSA